MVKALVIALLILVIFLLKDILSLRQKGWVLYYTPSCPYCVSQLKEFGWKAAALNKVNCEENDCPNVNAYPTWINTKTGGKVEGVVVLKELANKLI